MSIGSYRPAASRWRAAVGVSGLALLAGCADAGRAIDNLTIGAIDALYKPAEIAGLAEPYDPEAEARAEADALARAQAEVDAQARIQAEAEAAAAAGEAPPAPIGEIVANPDTGAPATVQGPITATEPSAALLAALAPPVVEPRREPARTAEDLIRDRTGLGGGAAQHADAMDDAAAMAKADEPAIAEAPQEAVRPPATERSGVTGAMVQGTVDVARATAGAVMWPLMKAAEGVKALDDRFEPQLPETFVCLDGLAFTAMPLSANRVVPTVDVRIMDQQALLQKVAEVEAARFSDGTITIQFEGDVALVKSSPDASITRCDRVSGEAVAEMGR